MATVNENVIINNLRNAKIASPAKSPSKRKPLGEVTNTGASR